MTGSHSPLELCDGVDLPTSAPLKRRTRASGKGPRSKSTDERSNTKATRPHPSQAERRAASPSRGRAALPDALPITLQIAVPLNIMAMRDWSPERRCEVGRSRAATVASHGDDLMFGGKHCAEAFNALAMGLAALAYQPGGASFLGLHWCVDAHPDCPSGQSSEKADAPPRDETIRQP